MPTPLRRQPNESPSGPSQSTTTSLKLSLIQKRQIHHFTGLDRQAISELGTKAIKLNASELVEWVNTYARPANELRNSVIHAVTYTAQDGVQALMTTAKHGRKRLSNPGLREISRFLIEASTRFPC
ncbi:hypothetical protein FRC0414_01368 [Corynebacterium diphtheriae]|nr:hypothetical protein FRC0430_01294 [Corynebacterium diphtheriae]CAB0906603.1 hypothetical protein FRC0414_01368 [Corynebacterium diphtheriae]CAB0957235.1 hypothetical protein FRC0436_01377 [Corynebacterium diphtheriae]